MQVRHGMVGCAAAVAAVPELVVDVADVTTLVAADVGVATDVVSDVVLAQASLHYSYVLAFDIVGTVVVTHVVVAIIFTAARGLVPDVSVV